MLVEEAKWLGEKLCALGKEYFPMVNIGSSTEVFRKQIQPHIDEYIFKPLEEQGKKVIHADIKNAEGVDLVGDLNDENFIQQVRNMEIKGVICSNLLEHVTSPQTICGQLENMVGSDGIIVISVPYRYPYHKDPIDTKFRPSIDELCQLFQKSSLIQGKIIISPDNQARSLWNNFRKGKLLHIFNIVKKWILPLHGMDEWKKARGDIFNLFKPFQVTCIILKKN